MKFLIAGLGSIGRRHLRNLQALGESEFLLYRTRSATLPDADLAGLPVADNLESALAQKPDAVIIANPTSLHLEIAIPAAEAGCHVLLEKPVSDSMQGLEQLAAAARRSGSRILVDFQLRFHPTLKKAADLIGDGALGRVLTVHAHWGEYLPNWHPWEDYRRSYAARRDLGGGVIRTITHPLDTLRWLVGEVEALWSFNGHISPLELDVEDAAEIGLRFVNGAIGGVHLNYFQRPPVHRWEIVGTAGTLRWDYTDGRLTWLRMPAEFGSYSADAPAAEAQTFELPEGFERNVLFLDQMRHFLSVVRGEVEPVCTLADGIRAQELALAALRSARRGSMVKLV